MDTTQCCPQVGVVKSKEEPSPNTDSKHMIFEKKVRQQKDIQTPLNCPRCNSTNTKFCYYNNYSLTQPRHFCKSCKRYWTQGGSLRNIPIGGSSTKRKKWIISSPSSSTTHVDILNRQSLSTNIISSNSQNPKIEARDLYLASHNFPFSSNFPLTLSALEYMQRQGVASRGFNYFVAPWMPDSSTYYTPFLHSQELKPIMNFDGVEENVFERLMFPSGG